MFLRSDADPSRVAASHNAVHFFNSGMNKSYPTTDLSHIVSRMLKAPQADVAKEGARECARWLFEGYFEYAG